MADTPPSRFRKSLRLMNRLGLSSLVLGICAALLKTWATYWLGPPAVIPDPVASPATPVVTAAIPEEKLRPRTVEDLIAASPISLTDWQIHVEQRYETAAQRERTFRPYLGKQIVWEGYFDQFHEVSRPEDSHHACTLILQESRSALSERQLLGPPSIRCWLPVSAIPKLQQLQRGDWVVIRGRLNNPLLAGSLLCTDVEETELIASHRIRAVETALSSSDTPLLR